MVPNLANPGVGQSKPSLNHPMGPPVFLFLGITKLGKKVFPCWKEKMVPWVQMGKNWGKSPGTLPGNPNGFTPEMVSSLP